MRIAIGIEDVGGATTDYKLAAEERHRGIVIDAYDPVATVRGQSESRIMGNVNERSQFVCSAVTCPP